MRSCRCRLKDGHQLSRRERARALERGRDLGRVVGVVVIQQRAGGAATERLKAPPGAVEAGQARDRRCAVGPPPVFRDQVTRHWHKALRRRSQKTRINWTRMHRIATRWLPPAREMHPFPEARFAATHPR